MKQTVRSSDLGGVRLTVSCYTSSFNVFIDIDEGCVFARRRKNKYCSIKFQTNSDSPPTSSKLQFELFAQEYPTSNYVNNFKQTIEMPNGMSFTISLSPEFYLSNALLKLYREQKAKGLETSQRRKAKKAEKSAANRFFKSASCGSTRSQPKAGGKSLTSYSYTNAFRPYQGGGCSSK